MKCNIITVANKPEAWVVQAQNMYLARLQFSLKIKLERLNLAKRSSGNPMRAIQQEGQEILKKRQHQDLIILDVQGKDLSTDNIEKFIIDADMRGTSYDFAIGGPDGLCQSVKDCATHSWSLSKLTLTHGMASIVLLEQLYRAVCCMHNHPYHRGS